MLCLTRGPRSGEGGSGEGGASNKELSGEGDLLLRDEDMLCEHCGEREATHTRRGYDICPTDRGNEERLMEERVCDECDHPVTRAAIRWPGRFLYD